TGRVGHARVYPRHAARRPACRRLGTGQPRRPRNSHRPRRPARASHGAGMSGGLPPRRPDQHELATPRGVTPGARITRLGGTAGSAPASANGAQLPTVFFTFNAKARIFTAGLSFTVGSNATYAASVTPIYAHVITASGLLL